MTSTLPSPGTSVELPIAPSAEAWQAMSPREQDAFLDEALAALQREAERRAAAAAAAREEAERRAEAAEQRAEAAASARAEAERRVQELEAELARLRASSGQG